MLMMVSIAACNGGGDGGTSAPPVSGTPAPAPIPGNVLGLPTFPITPTVVAPGTTAAALGAATTAKFSGLGVVNDTLHHQPMHAAPATWATLPPPLAGTSTPSISDAAVLNRRDALIVYVPAVRGAADYRAWIHDGSKVSYAGTQPRGAVIACAGYRQRFRRNINMLQPGGGQGTVARDRELLQAIEVPGLVANGDYTVIVEAIATPCPFPGVMAHTSATIPTGASSSFVMRGFNEVKSLYGNEILNGQGSSMSDYKVSKEAGALPAETLGQPVSPTSTQIPADPVVIARSAIIVKRPASDEAVNGPIFDVGSNALFDDFSTDGIMTSFKQEARSQGAGLAVGGQFKDWYFWTVRVQPALVDARNTEGPTNPKGAQVWQRHGRLYTSFGDQAQDVMGGLYFASTKTEPQELDASKYVHSMFRVDSGATNRRYWHWLMCGSAKRDELIDPATRVPRIRPVGTGFFQDPQGFNPSSNHDGEPLTAFHEKECLSLAQIGSAWEFGLPPNTQPTWFDEPHSNLHAFIHPAGTRQGVINLKPAGVDDNDTTAQGGMAWRLNAAKQPTGPMFEPFDQQAPLTHYDVFVRPDRVIFYVNGRQAWCTDLSDRPLTMKYGLIAYGSVLYHSGAENSEAYAGARGGSFHYIMNTPWADTRVWDAVGHSEKIDIPVQFKFDPKTCFKPKSVAVR